MAFEKKENAKVYQPKDGDTLKSIAAAETAAGNPITWQEIAQYNWGTQDEDEVQTFMRDELGTKARGSDHDYQFSADDSGEGELRIPKRFKQQNIPIKSQHKIRLKKKTCPQQFVECCSLPAITFGFNSSFIRPSVVEHLSELDDLAKQHKGTKLMVFGHTDAIGSESYNKKLSERRAWSAYGFIINDTSIWEDLYSHNDEDWGVKVIQEILADLGHDPGAIDDKMGPATKGAMRSFLGLPENASVSNDAAFRKDLFAAYMGGKHDIELTAEDFMNPGHMGCGEFNLLEDTDAKSEINRRVTFYFFNAERLPKLPCKAADTAPCKKQMVNTDKRHVEGFSCSFYDSWAKKCPAEAPPWQEVYLLDLEGHPIADTPYRARAGDAVISEGTTNGNGLARVSLSAPPIITIDWGEPPPGSNSEFRYSVEHQLEIPDGNKEESARLMLHNLGYEHDAGHQDFVHDFQEEWALNLSGDVNHIFEDLKKWHSTGAPPLIDEGDEACDAEDPWGDEICHEEQEEPEDGYCGCTEDEDDEEDE